MNRPEQDLQRQVCNIFDLLLPKDVAWFAIPNGGARSKPEAAIMKGLGTKAGIPDLCLIYRGRPHFIELKAPNGRLSQNQKDMHQRLTLAGAIVITCRSLEDVADFLGVIGIPARKVKVAA